jgi:hypothetical protein
MCRVGEIMAINVAFVGAIFLIRTNMCVDYLNIEMVLNVCMHPRSMYVREQTN